MALVGGNPGGGGEAEERVLNSMRSYSAWCMQIDEQVGTAAYSLHPMHLKCCI